jgi:hypothetical protein
MKGRYKLGDLHINGKIIFKENCVRLWLASSRSE